MKRLFFLLVSFGFIASTKAVTLDVCRGNNVVTSYEFTPSSLYDYYYITIPQVQTVSSYNKRLVGNLSALGNASSDIIYKATVAELIFEETHRETVTLKDSQNNVIDNSMYKDIISLELDKLNVDPKINGKTFTFNEGDSIVIPVDEDLMEYKADSEYSFSITSEKITCKRKLKAGTYKIDFIPHLSASTGRGYTFVMNTHTTMNPFSIYINVKAINKLIFNIDKTGYEYTFNVYDLDNNYIDTIHVNDNNKTYQYSDISIKLVDVTNNSNHELNEDIIINETGLSTYEVNLSPKVLVEESKEDIPKEDSNPPVIIEPITPQANLNLDDSKSISVPDTGIEVVEIVVYYNDEEKHYYYIIDDATC